MVNFHGPWKLIGMIWQGEILMEIGWVVTASELHGILPRSNSARDFVRQVSLRFQSKFSDKSTIEA